MIHAFLPIIPENPIYSVIADKTHRGRRVKEQAFADGRGSILTHPPSKTFTAKAAWLILAVSASNLTRVAGTIAGGALLVPPPPQ